MTGAALWAAAESPVSDVLSSPWLALTTSMAAAMLGVVVYGCRLVLSGRWVHTSHMERTTGLYAAWASSAQKTADAAMETARAQSAQITELLETSRTNARVLAALQDVLRARSES